MLANFLHLFTRRSTPGTYDRAFVKEVRVQPPRERRNRVAERWIVAGWMLILAKCALIWWASAKYAVPIHPLWLIIPTVLFGVLATATYIWRD